MATNERVCRECGEPEKYQSWPCVMAPDGEGPHIYEERPRFTSEERQTFRKIYEHLEQGGQER